MTGASNGIGREIAIELQLSGYQVIGTYNTAVDEVDEWVDR